jgi:hypothetical protein
MAGKPMNPPIAKLEKTFASVLVLGICITLAAFVPTRAADVAAPRIEGPIGGGHPGSTDHNYTFLATDLPLAFHGWIEQEFFISGFANVYDANKYISRRTDAPTATVISTDHPYKTNLVVRRPLHDSAFNGTVILEWTNVSPQHNNEITWFMLHDYLIQHGYAYVEVSAQADGLDAPVTGLKAWSPVRYGSLDVTAQNSVPKDSLSFDIFSQAAVAVRANLHGLMGDLKVKRIIGVGVSQSAFLLAVYTNSIQPLAHALNGVLLQVGGQKIREDLDIPVVKLNTESEYLNGLPLNQIDVLQPDREGRDGHGAGGFRLWAVPGTSHRDPFAAATRAAIYARDLPPARVPACKAPPNSLNSIEPVEEALLDDLNRWVTTGKPPPHAPAMDIVSKTPPKTYADVYGGHNLARDSFGNALGGIRLPAEVVPIARVTGSNYGPGSCSLDGSAQRFDASDLKILYPAHAIYVSKITAAANDLYAQGFILKSGRDALIAQGKAAHVP